MRLHRWTAEAKEGLKMEFGIGILILVGATGLFFSVAVALAFALGVH